MHLTERNKQRLGTWLVTIVLLAGGFGIYSYLYLEGRKQYFTERRLRELRLLGDQFKLRVENIANNVLPNAASASLNDTDCKEKTIDPATFKLYVTTDSSNTRLAVTDQKSACQYSRVSAKAGLVPHFSLEKFVEYRQFIPSNGIKVPPAVVPSTRVDVSTVGESATLLFTHQAPFDRDSYYAQKWRGSISANDLLGRAGAESFDQVMVTDVSGKVQFPFGTGRAMTADISALVRYVPGKSDSSGKGDGSESAQASAWAAVRDSSGVVPLKLAGEDYLLFIQPINISLTGTESPGQLGQRTPLDWRIAGLIRKDHFTQESSGFSYSVMLVFIFLVLLTVFAEPFIKISSLGPLDRLRKRDAIFLSISAALSIGFLTCFAAGFYAYARLEGEIDAQLRNVADKIQNNFDGDLTNLLGVLDDLSRKRMPADNASNILLEPSTKWENDQNDCSDAAKGEIGGDSGDPDPISLRRAFFCGAYFERIVWVDSGGQQRVKWTIYGTNTPSIPVGKRPYFTSVRDRQLFARTIGDQTVLYWFGKIVSWNTGESLATLSVPAQATGDGSFFVLTLDAILPSLRSVVMPPGYGFSVIEADGTVLFHSDPEHHLNENFFQESDQEPALEAAVFGRTTSTLDANYLGTGHRLYVKPITSPPWTLIVFYDKHYLRTSNLQILSLTLIAFLLMLIVQFPLLALLWFQDPRWLWFNEARVDRYPPYLVGMIGFILLFLIAITCGSVVTAVYAGFLIPSTVLLATYFRFRWDGSEAENRVAVWRYILGFAMPTAVWAGLTYCCWMAEKASEWFLLSLPAALLLFLMYRAHLPLKWLKAIVRPPAQTSYQLSIAALLVVVGVLPALAFLRLSYQNEVTLLLKHGQYALARSLYAREQRLNTEAVKIQGGKTYVEKRLVPGPLPDVYQDFFFAAGAGHCDHATKHAATFGPLEFIMKEVRARLLFDSLAVKSQGLYRVLPDAGNSEWQWDAAMRCLSFTPSAELSSRPSPPTVSIPDWWKPHSVKWVLTLMLLAAGTLSTVVLVTDFIAKRLFLLDLEASDGVSKELERMSFAAEWDKSSREEKLALYDFADDGFLNHENRAIRALLKRGLLCLHPLGIVNKEFRDFVLEKGATDEDVLVRKEENPSAWQKMKWPLFVAMLAFSMFLFFSQRKIFEGGVGFLGALATAATAFFNLLDQVRSTRR